MAREWKGWPEFSDVKTPWGLVHLAVTNSDHIAVESEKGRGGLCLKSQSYRIFAHVELKDGEWTTTGIYSNDGAPEATKKSFGKHLARFIAEWTDQHSEALVEAAEVDLNNKLRSAEERVEEAQRQLAEAKNELALLLGGF